MNHCDPHNFGDTLFPQNREILFINCNSEHRRTIPTTTNYELCAIHNEHFYPTVDRDPSAVFLMSVSRRNQFGELKMASDLWPMRRTSVTVMNVLEMLKAMLNQNHNISVETD